MSAIQGGSFPPRGFPDPPSLFLTFQAQGCSSTVESTGSSKQDVGSSNLLARFARLLL